MLKTVSSVANALGALNYKGTWNATTNTPTLASGVGTQGDYYVVSVAGTTNLDGITNWGVGDWAAFNGSVWQRVEGGADGNFDNLTALGTSTLTGNVQIVTGDLTVSAGKVIGRAGTGKTLFSSGDNYGTMGTAYSSADLVLGAFTEVDTAADNTYKSTIASSIGRSVIRIGNGTVGLYTASTTTTAVGSPVTLTAALTVNNVQDVTIPSGDLTVSAGNLVIGTSGKGIDFSATAGAAGEILDDYEIGQWTPTYTTTGTDFDSITYNFQYGEYVKIGQMVWVSFQFRTTAVTVGSASGYLRIGGLPFTVGNQSAGDTFGPVGTFKSFASGSPEVVSPVNSATQMQVVSQDFTVQDYSIIGTGSYANWLSGNIIYLVN